MVLRLSCAAALLLVGVSALAPQHSPSTAQQNRRQLVSGIFGAGMAALVTTAVPQPASATKALTGLGSVFTGDYDDPNHPGCLRQVKVVGAPLRGDGTRSAYPVLQVKGWDGNKDGMCNADNRPKLADIWTVEGQLRQKDMATIDFSPKGGPANLVAKWDTDGILFPDGNKWTKVPLGTPDRRPADLKTLSSGPR